MFLQHWILQCTVLTNSLLVAAQVCCRHQVQCSQSINILLSPIEKIALCFALFPQRTPARLFNLTWIYVITYHINLAWERSVCQGRPSASPKPLDPSKPAHPSRPFCIGDRMRLASLQRESASPNILEKITPRLPWVLGGWQRKRGGGGRGEGDGERGWGLMVARCISLNRFDLPNRDRHALFPWKGGSTKIVEQREDEVVDSWLRAA